MDWHGRMYLVGVYLFLLFITFSASTKCIKEEQPVWWLLHYIAYTRVERYLDIGRDNILFNIITTDGGMII